MTKTIPAEYLRLRLDQVLIAAGKPAPKRGPIELVVVLGAVRALAADIAQRDAERDRRSRAWLAEQIDRLPTSRPKPRARRAAK
jgi:hypothetical protein